MYNRILSVTYYNTLIRLNMKLNLNNGNYTINFLTHQAHFSENRPSAVFRFLFLVTLTFDLDIQNRARFAYSAPNHQVSSSYVHSFISYRADKHTDKQTDADENIHLDSLHYADG